MEVGVYLNIGVETDFFTTSQPGQLMIKSTGKIYWPIHKTIIHQYSISLSPNIFSFPDECHRMRRKNWLEKWVTKADSRNQYFGVILCWKCDLVRLSEEMHISNIIDLIQSLDIYLKQTVKNVTLIIIFLLLKAAMVGVWGCRNFLIDICITLVELCPTLGILLFSLNFQNNKRVIHLSK